MTTIKDIAALSGVSVGSVSYVINNQPGKVSADKRARVLEAMRQLNYRPRQSPRRDMLPSALTLGITSASLEFSGRDRYFGTVVEALLKTADSLGHNATVFATRLFHEDPLLSIRTYCDGQCAGLIVVAPGTQNPLIDALQNRGFPFIIFGDSSHDNASYCDLDNVASARIAVEEMLKAGHRRIAYCSGPVDHSSQPERYHGYQEALASWDIPVDPRYVSPPVRGGDDYIPWMKTILDMPADYRPTAICCFSDQLSIDLLDMIKHRGLSVPHDFSLIGFDDIGVDRLDPPLSAVRQPFDALARSAVDLLVTAIHNPDSAPIHVILPGEVVLRASIAPPGA